MDINVSKDMIMEIIQTKEDQLGKACRLMEYLGIPTDSFFGQVDVVHLYEVFTDEEKLKVLISKLHNKAFW